MTADTRAPVGIWRRYLANSAASSRFIATALVALVSVRFAIAGFERALSVSRANFAEAPASHAPTNRASEAPVHPPPAPSAAAPPAPSAVREGLPRRMPLEVSYGAQRSAVYVNGRLVGQTPFLGDTSCKLGLPVRIELVPDKGLPLTYVRSCASEPLEIDGPPP